MTGATIWPRQLPVGMRSESRRSAEVRVYDALSQQLGSGWMAFYSRPWHGEASDGAEIDGECDFVVAHADYGVLFIEVKGGAISYDPAADQWQSTDRRGIRHKIKNPVKQATDCKYQVLAKLKAVRGWPNLYIRFRHGVIFTDVDAVPLSMGADKPREIFATRRDLSSLATWVQQRLSGGNERPLGLQGLGILEAVLAGPISLSVPLANIAADDDETIESLTPQQFHILTAIQDLPRAAVSGGAGTGKTVLACEDARRQAAKGLRTLLTCGSEKLCEHLQLAMAGTGVDVATFANVARAVAGKAGLVSEGSGSPSNKLPELLFYGIAERPDLRYEAVIVDEAQDFPRGTWDAIDALVGSCEGASLHAYFDSNQRLYGDLRNHFDSYGLVPVRLSRNLRNTKNVHDAAQLFYRGPLLTADGPDGADVQWIEVLDGNDEKALIAEVNRLVLSEKVLPCDITVLTVSEASFSTFGSALRGYFSQGMTISTVHEFKGLERRFVVLHATKDLSDLPELAYVALSRARVHLSVIGTEPILRWLKIDGIG